MDFNEYNMLASSVVFEPGYRTFKTIRFAQIQIENWVSNVRF